VLQLLTQRRKDRTDTPWSFGARRAEGARRSREKTNSAVTPLSPHLQGPLRSCVRNVWDKNLLHSLLRGYFPLCLIYASISSTVIAPFWLTSIAAKSWKSALRYSFRVSLPSPLRLIALNTSAEPLPWRSAWTR